EPLALSAVAPSPPVARGWNLPDEGLSLTTSKGPSRSDVSLAAPTNFVLQRLPRINAPALLEDVLTAETEPPPLSIPVSVTGRIGQPDEVDSYQFTGRKDQRVVISAESRACDSPLDPYLKIFGPDGKLLKEAD